MRRKRFISVATILCLLVTASCASGKNNEDIGDTSDSTDTADISTNLGRLDELGVRDFGGLTYTVLDANDHPELHDNIPSEEADADVINNELYKRDLFISEQYGVNIEYEQIVNAKNGTQTLRQCVMSDEDIYTVCISTLSGGTLPTLATEGLLYDLNSNEYISLDQPWWSSLMYENLRLDDKMYFTAGDFSPSMYQMPSCIYINTELCSRYGIDTDIIGLVLEGKWTWDVLAEITKDLNKDVNNDMKMHANDDFLGFIHGAVSEQVSNVYNYTYSPLLDAYKLGEYDSFVVDINDKI